MTIIIIVPTYSLRPPHANALVTRDEYFAFIERAHGYSNPLGQRIAEQMQQATIDAGLAADFPLKLHVEPLPQ